jgi:hypothetical protein
MEDGRFLMPKKEKPEDEKLVDFIGETISTESALLAASINLMRAGDIAKESADAESLLKVSRAWYDLAKFLSGEAEEDEGKNSHFGFTALETIDEPGDKPNEGEGGIEICTKSW